MFPDRIKSFTVFIIGRLIINLMDVAIYFFESFLLKAHQKYDCIY